MQCPLTVSQRRPAAQRSSNWHGGAQSPGSPGWALHTSGEVHWVSVVQEGGPGSPLLPEPPEVLPPELPDVPEVGVVPELPEPPVLPPPPFLEQAAQSSERHASSDSEERISSSIRA